MNHTIYFFLLTTLLILASLLGMALGSTEIPIQVLLHILAVQLLPTGWVNVHDFNESYLVILWWIRIPRVIVAALVGASLALAGAQMQGLFQNPLASPDIIGTSSGGVLGAVIALATGLASYSIFYLPLCAILGAFLALFGVYRLAQQNGSVPVATLLLAGVAINALLGALTALVITFSWIDYEIAREMIFWLMGGLDSRTWSHVGMTLPGVILGSLIALFYSRELDILLLGQETAQSLGVDVERVKRRILMSTALLTGTAVAVSGAVGFVGLIIPHIVRLLLGPTHRYLLPASALMGATFLILADLLARTIHRPEEIRLGIVTAMFGTPFFIYLLLRYRRDLSYL